MVCRCIVAVAAAAAALLAAPSARGQDALTPAGPATVGNRWLGPVTLEGYHPYALVGWSVTVGPGGNAGKLRLRVLSAWSQGTVLGSGPAVWLSAVPGTYRFGLNPALPYDHRDELALDQEVGGHAIVKTHPSQPENGPDLSQLRALEVFRPPLAENASGVGYSERRMGEELLVRPVVEPDLDHDRLGDRTQDVGDLRLLRATLGERQGNAVLLTARVRNVGNTVRHLPRIVLPGGPPPIGCIAPDGPLNDSLACFGPPLAPGEQADLSDWVLGDPGSEPSRAEVGAEGPDTNPADNVRAVDPRLTLRVANRRRVIVSLRSNQPGIARVRARIAGVSIARTVKFTRAGRRTVRLMPRRRRARQRVISALRRPGRLRARVTASMARTNTSLRTKL